MELEPAREKELARVAEMIGKFRWQHMIIESVYQDGDIETIIIKTEVGMAVGVKPDGTVDEETDIAALEDLLDHGIDPNLN